MPDRNEKLRREVFAAADRVLRDLGPEKVTQRNVLRERGGKGSFSGLGDLLKEWRDLRLGAHNQVPDIVIDRIRDFAAELWQIACTTKHLGNASNDTQALLPHKAANSEGLDVKNPRSEVANCDGEASNRSRKTKWMVGLAVKEVLAEQGQPMKAADIYEELPDPLQKKVDCERLSRMLLGVKDSLDLFQIGAKIGSNDKRWWRSDLPFPLESLKRPSRNVYKARETPLAAKRRRHDELVERAVKVIRRKKGSIHFDEICKKLSVDETSKKEFRRALYRRSIYDKAYQRVGSQLYQRRQNSGS